MKTEEALHLFKTCQKLEDELDNCQITVAKRHHLTGIFGSIYYQLGEENFEDLTKFHEYWDEAFDDVLVTGKAFRLIYEISEKLQSLPYDLD